MRVAVFVKSDAAAEAGELPSRALLAAMGQYNEKLVRAGVMLAGGRLYPSSRGARVRFADGRRTVVDGPFAETKELVAGFWLLQVKTLEEAVKWVERCPFALDSGSEVEIRRIFEAADWGAAFTPELQAQEARPREAIAVG